MNNITKKSLQIYCMYLRHIYNSVELIKKKHYVVFHTQKIGIYPLTCYGTIKDTLEEIKPDLLKVLHSTCVIVEPNFTSQILKFFFSIYTPVRPACVIEDIKEADAYFSQEINQNTDLF